MFIGSFTGEFGDGRGRFIESHFKGTLGQRVYCGRSRRKRFHSPQLWNRRTLQTRRGGGSGGGVVVVVVVVVGGGCEGGGATGAGGGGVTE